MSVPIDKQIACVAREIVMRKSWYPRQVEAGRMKQEACDHEIAAMEAVLVTVKRYAWVRKQKYDAFRKGLGAETIADIPDGDLFDAFIDAAMKETPDDAQEPAGKQSD